LLGSEDIAERVDGIQVLGQLMHEFPDSQPDIVKKLVAFVRVHAGAASAANSRPVAADVQAALTELGSRPAGLLVQGQQFSAYAGIYVGDLTGKLIDLHDLDLRDADLAGSRLPFVDLSGANLSGATLAGAVLVSADLTGANLTGTELTGANLDLANLTRAELRSARGLTSDQLTCSTVKDGNLPRMPDPDSRRPCPYEFEVDVEAAPTAVGPSPGGR
jgi:hypothetical protein